MTSDIAMKYFDNKVQAFASAAGITRQHAYKILKETNLPINVQCRLEVFTKGALKANPDEMTVTCDSCGQLLQETE